MGRVALGAILLVVAVTAGVMLWLFQRTPESSTDVIAIFLVPVYAAAAIVVIGLVYLFGRVIVSAFRARRSPRPDNGRS